jgi:hypothetical protein
MVVDVYCLAQFYESGMVDNDILSGRYLNFLQAAGVSLAYRF